MKKPLVIKIGGAILERQDALISLLKVIKSLRNEKVVLVHGGGCVVDHMLAQAGLQSEKRHGLRVTPAQHMPIISGALAGTVNKTIVAQATLQKISAIGLSLADGGIAQCQLNTEGLGAVGLPTAHSSKLLDMLLNNGFMPVISSIGALANGEMVNVNADDAAVTICQLLNAELLLLTDVNGVKDCEGNYLQSIDKSLAQSLIEQGVIAGGMTAKINAAIHAANQLRRSIAVASWKTPEQILNLLAGDAIGTRVQPDTN